MDVQLIGQHAGTVVADDHAHALPDLNRVVPAGDLDDRVVAGAVPLLVQTHGDAFPGRVVDGLVNLVLSWFGAGPVDFIDGPYWAKMFVLCFYTIWVVLPFKILILTGALASVDQTYYNAAKVDGTPRWRIFTKITLPMISPTVFYLVITGFIGAFKAYSDAVALFGTNLNAAGMNTIVGYIYDMLYGDSGGYPSYASAAAIALFAIVLTITCINLLVSRKHVHY